MMKIYRRMLPVLLSLLLCSCGTGGERVSGTETQSTVGTEATAPVQTAAIDPDSWRIGADERIYIIDPGYPGIRCEGELRTRIEALVVEMGHLLASGQMREEEYAKKDESIRIWFDVGAGGADEPYCCYDAFYVYADPEGNCEMYWVHMPDAKTQKIFDYCFTSPYCADLVREIYDLANEFCFGES